MRGEAIALLTGGYMSIFLHILLILIVVLCAQTLNVMYTPMRSGRIQNYIFVSLAALAAYVVGAVFN